MEELNVKYKRLKQLKVTDAEKNLEDYRAKLEEATRSAENYRAQIEPQLECKRLMRVYENSFFFPTSPCTNMLDPIALIQLISRTQEPGEVARKQ